MESQPGNGGLKVPHLLEALMSNVALRAIKINLDRLDEYLGEDRKPGVMNGVPTWAIETNLMMKGISDLDFDPFIFLKSGQTIKEGWANVRSSSKG